MLDDPGEAAELRHALERLSTDLPDAARVARLAAHFGIAETPPVSPSPAGRAGAFKVALGAGILGLGVIAVLAGTRAGEPERTSAPVAPNVESVSAPSAAAPGVLSRVPGTRTPATEGVRPEMAQGVPPSDASPTSAPTTAEAVAPAAPSPEAKPGSGAPAEARSTVRAVASPAAPAPSSAARAPAGGATSETTKPPVAPPPSETELLRDARLVLNQNPAQALSLCEQHRREYPGGSMSQEREVIAITALAHLGRNDEARARAERFARAYPSSPYRKRVDAVVPP
jgi:hypothetical protein